MNLILTAGVLTWFGVGVGLMLWNYAGQRRAYLAAGMQEPASFSARYAALRQAIAGSSPVRGTGPEADRSGRRSRVARWAIWLGALLVFDLYAVTYPQPPDFPTAPLKIGEIGIVWLLGFRMLRIGFSYAQRPPMKLRRSGVPELILLSLTTVLAVSQLYLGFPRL